MLLTIPAFSHGTPGADSVLDLEPVLLFARQCRPDAVSLMPPSGPDDLPNGAALLAMKERLEMEGLRVVGGGLEIPADAEVTDESWQAAHVFETRAVIAALGEVGIDPLILSWRPRLSGPEGRQALEGFVGRLLDEADRDAVRLALSAPVPAVRLRERLETLGSLQVGACLELGPHCSAEQCAHDARVLADRLFAVEVRQAGSAATGGERRETPAWPGCVAALRRSGFSGPLLLHDLATPLDHAHALGYFRGLLAAQPDRPRSWGTALRMV